MNSAEHKELAEAHWVFLEKWLRMVFVDGWIHGAKHERQDRKEQDKWSESE